MTGWFDPASSVLLAILAGGLAVTAILCYVPDRGRSEVKEDTSRLAKGEWRWGSFTASASILSADAPEVVVRLELKVAGSAHAIWFDPAECRLGARGKRSSWRAPSSAKIVSFMPAHLPEGLARRGTIYGQGGSRVYELGFAAGGPGRLCLLVPVYDQVFALRLCPVLGLSPAGPAGA